MAPCFLSNLVGLIHKLLFAGHAFVHYDATIFTAAEAKGTTLPT
jgi:hypothetical protein